MPKFKYVGQTLDGEKRSGAVEAFDEYAAVTQVKEHCPVILKITPVKAVDDSSGVMFSVHIKEKDLSVLCSQFAIILSAGMPVVRAVELIGEQTTDQNLKRLLSKTTEDVAAGFTLAHSFQTRGSFLPTTFIEAVRSGEESGTLSEAFRRLQAYYDKSDKLKTKVRAATTYPMFTVIVAIAVVGIIMVKAVPVFLSSFQSMDMELPTPTKVLIAASNFCTHFWPLLLAIPALLVIGWKVYGRSEQGGLRENWMKLRIPILGKMALMRGASQMSSTLAMLLSAGVPVIRAVQVTSRVLDNRYLGHQLEEQAAKLEEGRTLTSCLRTCSELPDLLVEMVNVGEETGTLESTLEVVTQYYDNETEMRAQKAVTLLEPIVICILAVVVMGILMAVYLPMFTMYGNY